MGIGFSTKEGLHVHSMAMWAVRARYEVHEMHRGTRLSIAEASIQGGGGRRGGREVGSTRTSLLSLSSLSSSRRHIPTPL